MVTREERNKKEWIDDMVKELDTEEKLRADLECYYGLIQVNGKVISMLSNGLLSKPNYIFEVFEEFLEKYVESQKVKWLGKEIDFLEKWLDMYSEGENRMLVCERDISDRIEELKEVRDALVATGEGDKK